MTGISEGSMNGYVSGVTQLRKEFNSAKDADPTIDIIKKMRIIYGQAIIYSYNEKKNIIEKGIGKITDDEYVKISINASLLHVIHCHIKECETLAYAGKKGRGDLSRTSEHGDLHCEKRNEEITRTSEILKIFNRSRTNKSAVNIEGTTNAAAFFKKSATGTEELSIVNPPTTEQQDIRSAVGGDSEMFMNYEKNKSAQQNTSDQMDELTTDEFNRIFSEHQKNKKAQRGGYNEKDLFDANKFDVNKPTIINYWAGWCGASINFKPIWEKFVLKAKEKYPNLQVADLNTEGGKAKELAGDIKITKLPTQILYYNGTKYRREGSAKSEDDIIAFIKSKMSTNQ